MTDNVHPLPTPLQALQHENQTLRAALEELIGHCEVAAIIWETTGNHYDLSEPLERARRLLHQGMA